MTSSHGNYYTILEISSDASPKEIKTAYRRLSMIHHPDKHVNAIDKTDTTARFQAISEAYETLSDPIKKKEYDNSLGLGLGHGTKELFSAFSDVLFHFTSQHQQQQHQHHKPIPIICNMHVTMEQVYYGTTLPIQIERHVTHSAIPATTEQETIYVPIFKGIDDGEIIILRNQGHENEQGIKGDIKICVRIHNTTEFSRVGLDLVLTKEITLKEALCGFCFNIVHITGEHHTIQNRPGNIITHNYTKTIRSMGLERDIHVGNMVIIFQVVFPKKISYETIEQLQSIDF